MSRSWCKLLNFSLFELGLLGLVLCLAPLIVLQLKIWGFRRSQRILSFLSFPLPDPIKLNNSESLDLARRVGRIVNLGSTRGFIYAVCLPRSLLLWWFLRWRGITSEICIGVEKENFAFNAHAWVELYGVVVNDDSDVRRRYGVFDLTGLS